MGGRRGRRLRLWRNGISKISPIRPGVRRFADMAIYRWRLRFTVISWQWTIFPGTREALADRGKKVADILKKSLTSIFFFVKKIFLIYFPASVIRFVRHTMHVTNTARAYPPRIFLWFGFFSSKFCGVFNNVLFNIYFQFEIVVLLCGKKKKKAVRRNVRLYG